MPRRGENIFKRKDGRWEARFVKEIALDGKKKYGSVYAKSYNEVKLKRQMCINRQIIHSQATKSTIEEMMPEWLEEHKKRVKLSSYQKYSLIVRNHILPHLGGLPVKFLSANVIADFTNRLLSADKLSRETVNQVLLVLAMGLEYYKSKYFAAAPEIHLLKPEKPKMRVLTVDEQGILVRFLLKQDDIFALGIMLALFTGIRIGELCALNWEDIGVRTIHISKTMERLKNSVGKTEVMILPPKTASSDRVIPIPSDLLSVVDKYRKHDGYVLAQMCGKFVEPRLMQNKFAKCIKACGIERVNFHALRHTFATRCIEAGVDVKTLSEILGHSDVKTTLNKYVHSSFELKQISMDKLSLTI